MVFAHNDLLLGNVIYDSSKNCVTFIDYEYADMNYQPFDIGNHFAEFQGFINVNNYFLNTIHLIYLQVLIFPRMVMRAIPIRNYKNNG